MKQLTPNELRFNSYYTLSTNQVIKLDEKWIELYLDDKIGFEPIPLNEQWLEMFGFKKHGEWYCYMDYGVNLINISLVHKKTTFGCNEEYDINHIEFVHQLQNLYFSLCGQELQIKE